MKRRRGDHDDVSAGEIVLCFLMAMAIAAACTVGHEIVCGARAPHETALAVLVCGG